MLIEKLVPEIEYLSSPEARDAAKVRAMRGLCLTGPYGFVLGLILAFPALMLAAAVRDVYGFSGEKLLACAVLALASLSMLSQGLLVLGLRGITRSRMRTYIIGQGHPVCMCCGYDLRGNVSGVCPECGTLR